MPPGGGGLYYLAAQALTAYAEYAGFGVRVNGVYSCYTFGDGRTEHYATVACGSIANLNEGRILFETGFLEILTGIWCCCTCLQTALFTFETWILFGYLRILRFKLFNFPAVTIAV